MKRLTMLAAGVAALSSPAFAEVKTTTETGFSTLHSAVVDAPPEVIWKRLTAPKLWWNKAHSWSGSVDGFAIDARAGGCFCEAIQEKGADGKLKTVGTVEHMRVIYAHPQKVLRMQGALGPLQAEAVLGTLTVVIEKPKEGNGTIISFSYVVGGYMRQKLSSLSGAVDNVLGEQFKSLVSPWVPAEGGDATTTEANDKPVDRSKGKLILNIDDLVDSPQDEPARTESDQSVVAVEEAPAEGAEVLPAEPPKAKPKPKLKPLPKSDDGDAR